MKDREASYPRFARGLRVPFTDNPAERPIRMSRLRTGIAGCMRSMTGAGEFRAVRSCLATATRHGPGALEAIVPAFGETPGYPKPDRQPGTKAPASPSQNTTNVDDYGSLKCQNNRT